MNVSAPVAGSVFLLLALLALAAAPGRRPVLSGTALALTAVAAVHGLAALGGRDRVRPPFSDGPSWPAEVAAWRAVPARAPRAWPAGWTVDLSPRRAR